PLTAGLVAHAQPAPAAPQIVSAALLGHRVCGSFPDGMGHVMTFGCDPLPTVFDTGWVLTPPTKVAGNGTVLANTPVVVRLTTPTVTSLLVEYENWQGKTWPLEQIPNDPGVPDPRNVSPTGQVRIAASDNGYVKTWSLLFNLASCLSVAKINIYNVGLNGIK